MAKEPPEEKGSGWRPWRWTGAVLAGGWVLDGLLSRRQATRPVSSSIAGASHGLVEYLMTAGFAVVLILVGVTWLTVLSFYWRAARAVRGPNRPVLLCVIVAHMVWAFTFGKVQLPPGWWQVWSTADGREDVHVADENAMAGAGRNRWWRKAFEAMISSCASALTWQLRIHRHTAEGRLKNNRCGSAELNHAAWQRLDDASGFRAALWREES